MERILVLATTVLATGLAGCSGPPLQPSQLMTIQEAFPDANAVSSPGNAPSDAVRTATYDVPFEDVFRLANVSASQVQFHVESVQKARGLILASRSVMMRPHGTANPDPSYANWQTTQHRYFYAISVRELGPKRTEVRVASKVQGQCGIWPASMYIGTMGILAGRMSGENEYCGMLSAGMWAGGAHTSVVEATQFFTFLRNNLIAAGLM